MKIIADTHTHTNASTHALSTLLENVTYAKKNGLKCIAVTNHGPAIPDAPHRWHFSNLHLIPRIIDGIMVLRGAEANILDDSGNLDFCDVEFKQMDWVIASFHRPVCKPVDRDYHTRAYLEIAKNPYVDVIGHCGTPDFDFDYDRVIPVLKEQGKLIEINDESFTVRLGAQRNCREIAQACKKYGLPIVVNSDCHFAVHIGKVESALTMLREIDFPEELIINADEERFFNYIKEKKGLDYQALLKECE